MLRRTTLLLLVTAVCGLVSGVAAQEISGLPGAFVDVGVGAAPMGMGGATAVLARDVYAMVANPAGLTSVTGPQVALSTMKQFDLIPYNLILYAQPLGRRIGLGAGFLTAGDDALREVTVNGAVAYRIRQKLSLGLNLKYRHASFGDNADGAWVFDGGNRQVRGSANGFSLDLGARGVLGNRAAFAVVFEDVFGVVSYDASNEVGTAEGGSEDLSPGLVFGFGYVAHKYLTLELDLHKALQDETHDRIFLGIEQKMLWLFTLRAGVNQNIDADESNRQYALGASLSHRLISALKFAVDFAYLFNDIGDFFHVGLRVGWR